MNAITGFSKIEAIDPKNIQTKDLKKIYEVERDMWAREDWLWEYVKCVDCNTVLSKEDIYWDLSAELQSETVTRIENILWIQSISCTKCESDNTEYLFWDKYIDEINDRFKNSESYLVVYRDNTSEIRGFIDWYIDNFETIFRREFDKYYGSIWKEKIIKLIEFAISEPISNDILYGSALWMEKKFINFKTIINMFKELLKLINVNNRDILWLSEIKLNSSLHCFHSLLWSKPIWLTDLSVNSMDHNSFMSSDIFVNKNVVDNYRCNLSLPIKELVLKFKKQIISLKK